MTSESILLGPMILSEIAEETRRNKRGKCDIAIALEARLHTYGRERDGVEDDVQKFQGWQWQACSQ